MVATSIMKQYHFHNVLGSDTVLCILNYCIRRAFFTASIMDLLLYVAPLTV